MSALPTDPRPTEVRPRTRTDPRENQLSVHVDLRPAAAYPVSEWAQWHADRERALRQEHGWLSLTGFQWLPAETGELEGLAGRWQADPTGARASFAATDAVARWGDPDRLPVESVEAAVAEQDSLAWLRIGERQIELARRGGRYAIRIRDPRANTLIGFRGVPTFPLDPGWVRPARVESRSRTEIVQVDTARSDLRQDAPLDGEVVVELPDFSRVSLAGAVGADGRYSILFHDSTNGAGTAAWRTVATSVPDAAGRVEIDFNRALNMPFAFSDFGTCPAPVPGNRIPLAVTAGELTPVQPAPLP